MCAPCYARPRLSAAALGSWVRKASDRCADEVHESLIDQRLGRDGGLPRFFAPRAECLIYLFFSAARPTRTSRLLSCPRSVGGLRSADPALSFAKLRSD